MIIAVDGPAASGKGTIARALARSHGLAYLDTGRLYRLIGHLVLVAGASPDDEPAAVAAARRALTAEVPDEALRSDAVAAAASRVASIRGVRAVLLDLQRDFARRPPGGAGGAVLDGRDIGTVICPNADVKLFVVAGPEVRARRRHAELASRGESVSYETVLADIRERDARDASRAAAPLAKAADAHLLDTSELGIAEAVAAAEAIIARVAAR